MMFFLQIKVKIFIALFLIPFFLTLPSTSSAFLEDDKNFYINKIGISLLVIQLSHLVLELFRNEGYYFLQNYLCPKKNTLSNQIELYQSDKTDYYSDESSSLWRKLDEPIINDKFKSNFYSYSWGKYYYNDNFSPYFFNNNTIFVGMMLSQRKQPGNSKEEGEDTQDASICDRSLLYVDINGVLFKVLINCKLNRKILETIGEDHKNDNCDKKTLQILLAYLAHDRYHGQNESIEARRNTLYNVVITTALLSKNITESRDYRNDGRSIWRDIQFLSKLVMPQNHPAYNRGHHISDDIVDSILNIDCKLLGEIAAIELSGSEDDKKNIRNKYRQNNKLLRNIYAIVNYYREIESLEKILKYTNADHLNSIKDITSPTSRFVIFRILEIIGEYVHLQNLSKNTRCEISNKIKWEVLGQARTRLSHNEWDITGETLSKIYDQRDLSAIINHDIPKVYNITKSLHEKLKSFKNDTEVSNHYLSSPKLEWIIPPKVQEEILEWCDDLHANNNITKEFHESIKDKIQRQQSLNLRFNHIINNIVDVIDMKNTANRNRMTNIRTLNQELRRQVDFIEIQKLVNELPNDTKFKKMKNNNTPLPHCSFLKLTIDSIKQLMDIVTQLPSGSDIQTMEEEFGEYHEFSYWPNKVSHNESIQAMSDLIKRYLAMDNPNVKNKTGLFFPASILSTTERNYAIAGNCVYKLSSDDGLLQLPKIPDFIKTFKPFVELCEALRTNFICCTALEYIIGTINQYIDNLKIPASIEEYIPECNALRRVIAHGNLYVDLAPAATFEGGIIRYTSLYAVKIKPKLEEELWKSDIEQLRQHAQRRGLEIIDENNVNNRDGNCFFHAVADQLPRLGITNHTHESLRNLTVNHIQQSPEEYQCSIEGGFDNYIEGMRQLGTWADHIAIQALSRELGVNIVIIVSDNANATIIECSDSDADTLTLHLGYEAQGRHYHSLVFDESIEPEELIYTAAHN